MMGGDEFLRVSRFTNGFSVEIKDPGIVKFNKAQDEKKYDDRKTWKDPWRTFIFDTAEKACAFLEKNLDKAVVAAKDEDATAYDTSFTMASSGSKEK